MIIERLCIPVSLEKRQEIGKALLSLIGPIQVEPGCVACCLSHAWPKQDEFHIDACWDSEHSLIQHLQSENYKRLLLLIELSTAPPTLKFFTVLEVRGLDLVESARNSSN